MSNNIKKYHIQQHDQSDCGVVCLRNELGNIYFVQMQIEEAEELLGSLKTPTCLIYDTNLQLIKKIKGSVRTHYLRKLIDTHTSN